MSTETLEKEVEGLRRRLEKLEANWNRSKGRSWREAVGQMKDCDLFDEAIRLGAEFRAKANA